MAGSSKEKMKSLLAGEQAKPEIQRGQGVRLSTQAEPETQDRTNAESQNRRNANTQNSENANTEVKRVNRGYMLREDYIKALKKIAVDEDKNLYEVMEEAFKAYLDMKQ